MSKVKYPHIHVRMVGENGNAFAILGRVGAAMRQAGISVADQTAFRNKATSGDYNHLLQTVMSTVNCDDGVPEEAYD